MGPTRVYFFFISGSKKGRIEAIEADVIRIGRQPYCELALDPYQDIPASGDHARVIREAPDRWALVDSGSSWGTWKNDVRVMGKVPLLTGDVITCGHDDKGRAGPRIRFYSDRDILRCPGCDGPVYKRHFRCPTCTRKYCLRCIDFRTQTCKPCGARPATAPAAMRPQIVPAPATARAGLGGGEGLDGPFCNLCNEFVRVPVFTCGGCRRTFCADHRQPNGSCPLCAGAGQVLEDWGRGSEPELTVPDQALYQPPGGSLQTFTPPPPAFPSFGPNPPTSFENRGRGPDTRGMLRAEIPRTVPPPNAPPPAPPTVGVPRKTSGPGDEQDMGDLGEFQARKPPTIPCERCQAPLAARDFFVCSMCRGRLCSRHRMPGTDMCDLCGSSPVGGYAAGGAPPSEPGRELLSTAGDDANARPPWRRTDHVKETTADTDRALPRELTETAEADGPPPPPPPPPPPSGSGSRSGSGTGSGLGPAPGRDVLDLSGVQFECPYCDAPITQTSRTCPKCKREL